MMSPLTTLPETLRRLIVSLPARRRAQLIPLLLLMLIGALAEVVSLGAIVPFLAVLVDPVQALERPLVAGVIDFFGIREAAEIRWQITVLFACAAVTAGLVRLILIYAIARINFGIGHEFGAEVYRRTLYQPYDVHLIRNSSEIMGGLQKVDVVVMVVFALLNACSAILISVFIVAALILIDPSIAITALLGFGLIYATVSLLSRKRLAVNSSVINRASSTRLQAVQEGLGGIRDVLLDQSQPIFSRRFNEIDWAMRRAQASNFIIGPSPRYVVEALGMVLIALLGYRMTSSTGGIMAAIPTLGALALGAQRLMPLLQQIYQGWVIVAGNSQVLVDVAALLQQPLPQGGDTQADPLPFEHELTLRKVSFQYQPHLPNVLEGIHLTIPKGARVGLIGPTGSGKSTVMDLLMGLLEPTEGEMLVDGIRISGGTRSGWQRNVAHVPQAIFLADASFEENIAFGVPPEEIDIERVRAAAKQAQIADFIEAAPEAYKGMVGERGVRLSGGQRQRLGIARALYKRATVLVFDEATSALDSDTETTVMQAIDSLGPSLTVLVIAHRLGTLSGCDVIYRLDKGVIQSAATFEQISEQSVGQAPQE